MKTRRFFQVFLLARLSRSHKGFLSACRGRILLDPRPHIRQTEQRIEKLRAYVRQQEKPQLAQRYRLPNIPDTPRDQARGFGSSLLLLLYPRSHCVSKATRALAGRSIVLNAVCPKGRQVGNVPAAAKSFDEEDAGIHTPAENVDRVPFVCEFGRLCSDDL